MNVVFNQNYLNVQELGVVSPDVRKGRNRHKTDWALEEWFYETKLADSSPNYDFISIRAGSQPFTSDFRGFIFSDTNRGVRIFGNRLSNQDQYNAEFSFHYNKDKASEEFDNNGFLVRPDPVGVLSPHQVDAYYLGMASNVHINRFNINHAAYYVLGKDELNPIAGKPQDISAFMGALELSYDRDWARFRCSYFYASGDSDPNDDRATGFDAIFDNANFAVGEFCYWNRQQIRLFGVNLVKPRFRVKREPGQKPKLIQRSNVEKDLAWEVTQTADTKNPKSLDYNPKSHIAKTVRMDDDGVMRWGDQLPDERCAHQSNNMSCIACHSSWRARLAIRTSQPRRTGHFRNEIMLRLTRVDHQ